MEIMTNKKLKKDQQVDLEDGNMEQLNSDAEQLAVENVKPAVDFGYMGVFPEEIWLHVLDKVAHSEDIVNALKAFPELDKAFQSKKAEWFFDQVLPHLMTKYLVIEKNNLQGDHVDSKELLKLRLISKRWKGIVESTIQNHADRHPIDSGSEIGKHSLSSAAAAEGAVVLPVNHFNYYRINKYHLGATVFRTPEQITNFFNEMSNCQGNPFPGKDVYFDIDKTSDGPFQNFVMKAVELLLKFGKHVHFLGWEIGNGSRRHLKMCKAILKGLSSAPNLKSLKIFGDLDGMEWTFEKNNEYFSKAESLELFPRLEKLESFDWQVELTINGKTGTSAWVDRMIELYAGGSGRGEQNGLRRLALDHKYWNVEMAVNLKNLTELHLLLDVWKEYDVDELGNVLRMFPKGQLKKFELSDYPRVKKDREIYIDELIRMLGEFEIENVVLEELDLKEKVSDMDAVGVTSLHLDDSLGLSYEFLKRLPNLKSLSVYVNLDMLELTHPRLHEDKSTFAFYLRQYFWKAHESLDIGDRDGTFDIWKECKKLEMLTASVVNGYNVCRVQFVREYGDQPFCGWSGLELEDDDEIEIVGHKELGVQENDEEDVEEDEEEEPERDEEV